MRPVQSALVTCAVLFLAAASAFAQSRAAHRASRPRASSVTQPSEAPTPATPPATCDACRMVPDASFEDPTLSRLAMCVRPHVRTAPAAPTLDAAFDSRARPRRRMPPQRAWEACTEDCCQVEHVAVDVHTIGFVDHGPERHVFVTASASAPPNATSSAIVPRGDVTFFYTCSLVRGDHDYCASVASHPSALLQTGHAVTDVYRGDGPNGVVIASTQRVQFVPAASYFTVATVHRNLRTPPNLRTDVGPMVVDNPQTAPEEMHVSPGAGS